MAEIEIEMPDGTVLAFPDTMSQEDMQAAAQGYWAQNSEAQPVEETPVVDAPATLDPAIAAGIAETYGAKPTQSGVQIPEAMLAQPKHGGPRAIDAFADRGFTVAVAQVGDGVVLRDPSSGALVFSSPGRNITDQNLVEKMLAERDMGAVQQSDAELTLDMNPLQAAGGAAANYVSGVPLVGSYIDEAMGAIGGPNANANVDAMRDTYATARPKRALALQLGGAATGTAAALAATPANAVLGGGSTAAQIARGIGFGGATGAIEGAVYGAGLGEQGSRMDNAQSGGAWGGTLGAGIGAVIPFAGATTRAAFNASAGRKARAAARELGLEQDAARMLSEAIDADSTTISRNLAQAGQGATLANAGPTTRVILDAVTNAPGKGAAIARAGIGEVIENASGRFRQTLDAVLGPVQGPRATMAEIMRESATPRKEAYDAAFAAPIDYASEAGYKIEAAMRRVDPTDMQAAVREANAQMRDLGIENAQIRATISDAGEVVFDKMPDVRQANALKMGLDTIAENSKNPISGIMTPQGVRASRQARALRDAVGEAVPVYKEALKLGGDAIAERNAVDLGRTMLRRGFTREQMAEALEGMDATDLARVRQGLRSNIDDTMANVKKGLGQSDSDAKEVLQQLRDLTADATRTKVLSVLGPDEGAQLVAMLDEAEQAFSLGVKPGSPTAQRTQVDNAIREMVPTGIADEVVDKGVIGTVSSIAGRAAKAGGQTPEQGMAEIRAHLARTLTETGDVQGKVAKLRDFGELGEATQRGAVTSKNVGQGVALGTLPPLATLTRPEANNRKAILRKLAEKGYTSQDINEIMMGGPSAIDRALGVN